LKTLVTQPKIIILTKTNTGSV